MKLVIPFKCEYNGLIFSSISFLPPSSILCHGSEEIVSFVLESAEKPAFDILSSAREMRRKIFLLCFARFFISSLHLAIIFCPCDDDDMENCVVGWKLSFLLRRTIFVSFSPKKKAVKGRRATSGNGIWGNWNIFPFTVSSPSSLGWFSWNFPPFCFFMFHFRASLKTISAPSFYGFIMQRGGEKRKR